MPDWSGCKRSQQCITWTAVIASIQLQIKAVLLMVGELIVALDAEIRGRMDCKDGSLILAHSVRVINSPIAKDGDMLPNLDWPTAEEVEREASVIGMMTLGMQSDAFRYLRQFAAIIHLFDGQATGMVDEFEQKQIAEWDGRRGNSLDDADSVVLLLNQDKETFALARTLEKLLGVAQADMRERCAKVCEENKDKALRFTAFRESAAHAIDEEAIRSLQTGGAK